MGEPESRLRFAFCLLQFLPNPFHDPLYSSNGSGYNETYLEHSRPLDRLTKMNAEGPKLLHETYKHLTTLSSASLILSASFFAQEDLRWVAMLWLGMFCFLASSAGSVVMMFTIANQAYNKRVPSKFWQDTFEGLALAGFLLGLILLALFGQRNFGGDLLKSFR
jgi:hypothetical protein